MKEFVAKTKMCPMRISGAVNQSIKVDEVINAKTTFDNYKCEGSGCMMWEWHDKSPITRGDPNSTAGETIEYEQVEGDCGLKK